MQNSRKYRLMAAMLIVAMSVLALPARLLADDSNTFRDGVAQTLEKYYELEQFIFVGNLEKAAGAAKELTPVVQAVNTADLTPVLKSIWEEQAKLIIKAAAQIEAGDDVVLQRQGFLDISNGLIAVIRKMGSLETTAYLYHCPMALNTGGHWLSKTKDVVNPYLGEEMPGCGTLVETFETK